MPSSVVIRTIGASPIIATFRSVIFKVLFPSSDPKRNFYEKYLAS